MPQLLHVFLCVSCGARGALRSLRRCCMLQVAWLVVWCMSCGALVHVDCWLLHVWSGGGTCGAWGVCWCKISTGLHFEHGWWCMRGALVVHVKEELAHLEGWALVHVCGWSCMHCMEERCCCCCTHVWRVVVVGWWWFTRCSLNTLHVSTAPGAGRVDGDGGGVLLVHVAVRLGSKQHCQRHVLSVSAVLFASCVWRLALLRCRCPWRHAKVES